MRLAGAVALPLLLFLSGIGSVARGQTATRPARTAPVPRATKTLDIYVSDTEGGKGTLFVTPAGETVLVDTGNPGDRDVGRIMDMIHAAGVTRIDYLISTHYHTDHVGGLTAIAARIPVAHFMDHGVNSEVPEAIAGFQAAYADLYSRAKHTVLKPGDRVPLLGVDWRIVTSAGHAIGAPLAGAGKDNTRNCADFQRKPDPATPDDNAQSVGSVITFGQFRALDLGDLLWNNEYDLVCPRNLIGTVDLYLVTHHGLDRSGSPALVHSVLPRVAVMQNGPRKGGAPTTFQTLRQSPGLEDIWTSHWSYAAGVEHNSPGVFIANLDDMATIAAVIDPGAAAAGAGRGNPAHAPAYPFKISAQRNGTFTVSNLRNGFSKTYSKR
jgi:competence protein ComEC